MSSSGPCYFSSNHTCNFLDCGDSPLSISGNVISILTFFIAAIATYLAFFRDVRDIPQSADDYSNDIRSLHDQLWTIGDIHSQLAKLLANGENLRISNVGLQARLQQGPADSLKEARKFLDDYSASYQSVFTDYFKQHRSIVRLKWVFQQKKVAHFKQEASELRNAITLDLLAITLNMNIALQQTLHDRDVESQNLSKKFDALMKSMGHEIQTPVAEQTEKWNGTAAGGITVDSPSPSVMIDPSLPEPPTFVFSPPEDDEDEAGGGDTTSDNKSLSPSRSASPTTPRSDIRIGRPMFLVTPPSEDGPRRRSRNPSPFSQRIPLPK